MPRLDRIYQRITNLAVDKYRPTTLAHGRRIEANRDKSMLMVVAKTSRYSKRTSTRTGNSVQSVAIRADPLISNQSSKVKGIIQKPSIKMVLAPVPKPNQKVISGMHDAVPKIGNLVLADGKGAQDREVRLRNNPKCPQKADQHCRCHAFSHSPTQKTYGNFPVIQGVKVKADLVDLGETVLGSWNIRIKLAPKIGLKIINFQGFMQILAKNLF
jgi:hypothetical protein